MSNRGYLWENLQEEIVAEFTALGRPMQPSELRKLGAYVITRADGPEKILPPQALKSRRAYARSVASGQCVKCAGMAREGKKTCQPCCDDATERNRIRRRGMKERLPDERGGVTHHFSITAKCDRKKCQNNESPNQNCSQCGGEGVYQFGGYIIANRYVDGRLAEVFVRAGKAGSTTAWLDQWAIAISIALQFGAPVDDVFRKFVAQSFEPSGPTRCAQIRRCSGVTDYVARWCLLKFGSDEARERVAAMAGVEPVKMEIQL